MTITRRGLAWSGIRRALRNRTLFARCDSDHLQLIKFWPSRAPGKGGLRLGENFRLRLTTASAQCFFASLWALFFHFPAQFSAHCHRALFDVARPVSPVGVVRRRGVFSTWKMQKLTRNKSSVPSRTMHTGRILSHERPLRGWS